MTHCARTHSGNIHPRILENSNISLCDAKLRVDAVRGQIILLADHLRLGAELNSDLLEAVLFRLDQDLAEVSDSISNELCGVDHG